MTCCPNGPLRFLLLFLPLLLALVALALWMGLNHQLHLPLDLIYDYFPLSVLIFQNFFFFFSYVIFLTSFCICKYEPIRMNDFSVIFSGLGIFVPKVNET